MSDFTVLITPGLPQHVAISGEIDMMTAPQIDAALATLSGDINVDCTNVTFIDSAGFHALDRGHRAAVARGTTFEASDLGVFHTRIANILGVPYLHPSQETPRAA
jgi:anti-anti-sigma regulatory factor